MQAVRDNNSANKKRQIKFEKRTKKVLDKRWMV
jgi:hypothetical protein